MPDRGHLLDHDTDYYLNAENFDNLSADLIEYDNSSSSLIAATLQDAVDELASSPPGSLVLGETNVTAYRGDRGKTAYDHSQLTSGNPHSVTKSEVGLGSADNTADSTKPVSTAQAAADAAVLAAAAADATTKADAKVVDSIADSDTAHAPSRNAVYDALALKADLASPSLSGTPTAPTAAGVTNTTQIATTAMVQAAIALLINSSPSTLDTLKELADAIGDDPNFATTVSTAIAAKVTANVGITGATKTKITYDAKGLVTAGADAVPSDITGFDAAALAAAPAETLITLSALLASMSSKTTPVDTDYVGLMDSVLGTPIVKKLSWANIKATLLTYFDTKYPSGSGTSTGANSGDNAVNTLYSGLAASKQDTLVSATNIKTINSTSILGSGDLLVTQALASSGTTTIAAGYAAYVPNSYEVSSGNVLDIGSGAVFEIG